MEAGRSDTVACVGVSLGANATATNRPNCHEVKFMPSPEREQTTLTSSPSDWKAARSAYVANRVVEPVATNL